MTDPEPASPPCQAPPGFWDAEDQESPPAEKEPNEPPPESGDE